MLSEFFLFVIVTPTYLMNWKMSKAAIRTPFALINIIVPEFLMFFLGFFSYFRIPFRPKHRRPKILMLLFGNYFQIFFKYILIMVPHFLFTRWNLFAHGHLPSVEISQPLPAIAQFYFDVHWHHRMDAENGV